MFGVKSSRLICRILLLTVVVVLFGFGTLVRVDAADKEAQVEPVETVISDFFGSMVRLELTTGELMEKGFDAGDMVSVKIGDSEPVTMPFVERISGIGFRKSSLGGYTPDSKLMLHMSGVDLGETFGIEKDQAGIAVTIGMAGKGAFLNELQAWNYGRMSNDRGDFPNLSDEEFANHRMVRTTGMMKGILYRTSSPINPMINRNLIADKANKKAGVTTIINLSESPESAKERDGYEKSYYVKTHHIEVDMKTDFGSEDFNSRLVRGLKYMIANPGVFEVNCIYGKDRTGFMIAVLEALAGASYDELIEDYAATFRHYYPDYDNYEPIEERDRTIGEGNLIAQMQYAYGVDDLKNADLAAATEDYLRKNGMTDSEIKKLRKCLTTNKYIIPKGTVIKTLKLSSRKAVVKWRKQKSKIFGSHITGYKIQLATNRKFTKNKKTITVKGYKKTSAKIGGLKRGKKYYARILTYKKAGSKQFSSKWSAAFK